MDDKAIINRNINEIKKIDIERKEIYFTWLKNIIAISTGFLGIIVSLKSNEVISFTKHVFFVISISSLLLGILSGVIILYGQIHVLNKFRKNLAEHTKLAIEGKTTISEAEPALLKGYDLLQYFCYSFYIIALICLIIYASIIC